MNRITIQQKRADLKFSLFGIKESIELVNFQISTSPHNWSFVQAFRIIKLQHEKKS